jgi:hypothetical protein
MGASPLFPLFVALFFLGIAGLGRNHFETIRNQTAVAADTVLQAGTFLRYRDVVTVYTLAHPGWTGTVPASYLNDQGITAAVRERISHQVVASTAGRQIVVYASMAGQGYEVYRQVEGDASIGLVVNGQFQSFGQGAPAALPITVPSGDVISFVEVGN